MERLIDLVLVFGFVSAIMLPLCLMAWFTEETRIGKRLMDKVMRLLDLE
jgi:hypothetical protein